MKNILSIFLLFSFNVSAQWSGDSTVNNPISTASGYQNAPTIVSDGLGGAIITWQDSRNGNSDIYAQRIDASGVVQWTADGVAISSASSSQVRPNIVSDNSGGAIISWEDSRNGNFDLYAQRIDASGIAQWTADGVAISTASNLQSWPTIASDGSGGAIISWQDDYYNPRIYAQRINVNGVVQWTANGVAISTVANSYYPVIVSDNSGGGIITWSDFRNGTNHDIYAQRINASGGVEWPANGVPICTASLTQSGQTILSDGSGGAIIAWSDLRGSWMQQNDVYAQRINASGIVDWPVNGVPISTIAGTDQRAFGIVSDGSGGVIISWLDSRSGIGYPDIYMQRIDGYGVAQWVANGVQIYISANENSAYHGIVSDGSGGAIITWHDDHNNTHIYAQRVNTSGVVQWTANGVLISTVSINQQFTYPKIISNDSEGAIITWGDARNGNQDIYAQRVRSDGSLGGDFSITRPQAGEKWIAGETDTIRWTGGQPGQFVSIEYSADNGQTYSIVDVATAADSHYFVWNIPNNILSTRCKLKFEDVLTSTELAVSDSFKIKPYVVTRLDANGDYIAYNRVTDAWNFANFPEDMWPMDWYNQFNYQGIDPFTGSNYSQLQCDFFFASALSSEHMDWVSWVNAFGVNSCYHSTVFGIYNYSALLKWEATNDNWAGSCFGIAASNALAFSSKDHFLAAYQSFPSFFSPITVMSDTGVKRVVNELFTHQFGNPSRQARTSRWNIITPNETLNEIKAMLKEDSVSIRTLSLWNNTGSGGHSILAYGLEQDETLKEIYYLLVYDNSHPFNENAIILIDTTGNSNQGTWLTTYAWTTWGGPGKLMLEIPSENYLTDPILPRNSKDAVSPFILENDELEIYTSLNANTSIIDLQGNISGYNNGIVLEEIPFSVPLMYLNGSETPPYGYSLQTDNYSIALNDLTEDTVETFFFTGNKSFVYERNGAAQNQTDRLFFDGGVSVANPDVQTKIVKLLNLISETSQEKLTVVRSLELVQNDSVKIENPDSNTVKLISYGSTKNYDIELNYVAENGIGKFENFNITLPSNTSHTLIPDWENVENSALQILVDLGIDGTIDDTLEVENQYGTTTTFQLAVTINNGWNMVSVPGLHPTNQNVNTWWSGKDPAAGVFRYSGGYQSVTDAAPGTGYWMKHLGVNTYNTGEEWPAGGIQIVAHNPLNGQAGWNLIGGYEQTVATASLTTNPPGLITGPIYGYSGGYQVASDLVPGYGYWVKLNSAGEINIPGSLSKGNNATKEYFEDKWGKIIITDAAGMNYTLYAITGNVDLNQYELPPAPPEGMFDVRFGSGRIAEDINSSVQSILFSGIEHPFTVRAENIDIILQDESGMRINANLKSGEEITISHISINKLTVSGELVPAKYELEQNYPNPFNPATTIKYSIAKQSNVTLKVYDMLGSEIATLVNEEKPAGVYEINFNASNLASGIYFYKIQAGSFIETKKMLMLK